MEPTIQAGTQKCRYDEYGREILDEQPMEMPINFKHPPTIRDMIRQMIVTEVSRAAEAEGYETFEEADDFDTGEDNELSSPYELDDEMSNRSLGEFVEEIPRDKPDPQPDSGGPKPPKKDRPAQPADPPDPDPDSEQS